MFGGIGYGFAPYGGLGASIEIGKAEGFAVGAFGTPTAFYNQVGDASGFQATQFGSVFAQCNQEQSANGWRVPTFGTPFSPYLQTGYAQGFLDTQDFGTGSTHFAGTVTGFNSTALGVVSSAKVQPVTGFSQQATFGTAQSGAVVHPATWASTDFGTPQNTRIQGSAGSALTPSFGQTTALNYHLATGSVLPHFGMPTGSVSGVYESELDDYLIFTVTKQRELFVHE